jgi:TFIIF-interacting CTD phosphatase-like protein
MNDEARNTQARMNDEARNTQARMNDEARGTKHEYRVEEFNRSLPPAASRLRPPAYGLFIDGKERVERSLAEYARVVEPAVLIERVELRHRFRRQIEVKNGQVLV